MHINHFNTVHFEMTIIYKLMLMSSTQDVIITELECKFAKKKQYKLRYSSHLSRKETVQSIKENLLFLSNQQVMKEQKKKIFDYGFMVFCFKLKSMLIAQCIKRHENSGKPLHVHHFSNHLKCSINREKALEKRGFHNC